MNKLASLLSAGIIGISLFTSIWKNSPLNFVLFLDTMFALSLLSIMVGATLFLLRTNFFHPVTISFQQFFRQISRARQMADEVEQKKSSFPKQQRQFPWTSTIFFTGLFWFFIASFVSIIL